MAFRNSLLPSLALSAKARSAKAKIRDQARACLDRLLAVVVPLTFASASSNVEAGPTSVSGGYVDPSMSPVEARRLRPSVNGLISTTVSRMKNKQAWSAFLSASALLSPPGGALFAGISADAEEAGEAATMEHDPSLVCLRRECREGVAEVFPEVCSVLLRVATGDWATAPCESPALGN